MTDFFIYFSIFKSIIFLIFFILVLFCFFSNVMIRLIGIILGITKNYLGCTKSKLGKTKYLVFIFEKKQF